MAEMSAVATKVNSVGAMFAEAPELDREVPFDEIDRICLADGSFLDSEHTLELFRDVLHIPDVFDRSARTTDREELAKAEGLLDRCQEKYERLRDNAPEFRAPDDVCKAVDAVVARATRELA